MVVLDDDGLLLLDDGLLLLLFSICKKWSNEKVNYTFIPLSSY